MLSFAQVASASEPLVTTLPNLAAAAAGQGSNSDVMSGSLEFVTADNSANIQCELTSEMCHINC